MLYRLNCTKKTEEVIVFPANSRPFSFNSVVMSSMMIKDDARFEQSQH